MQVAYKFKLRPNPTQFKHFDEAQHLVGYVQNRALGDRQQTYLQIFVEGAYCDPTTQKKKSVQNIYTVTCQPRQFLVRCIVLLINRLHWAILGRKINQI